MKKIFCALLICALLFAPLCLAAAADFDYADPFAEYTVQTADSITYDYRGETSATVKPQGGSSLSCLIDGEIVSEPTTFSDPGIVLVCNDFIKPDYEVDMATAEQPLDAIPEFYFTLSYDEAVTFDTIYMSLFYQVFDCVTAPGENRVIVEVSDDGDIWLPVGDDGMFYYRTTQPEYTGEKDPYQEEIVVPLGEEVESRYVRLTFTFKIRPESDTYWAYYTNVYEWAGFTELAVASYTGGDKQEVMTPEYATAPALDLIDTVWYAEDEDSVAVMSFYQKDGAYYTVLASYDPAAFAENGIDAEPLHTMETTYVPGVDYIIVNGQEPTVIYITVDGDTMTYGDGLGNEYLFDAYLPEPDDESSSETPSEPEAESSEEASSEPEEESEEASKEESKPASAASSAAESTDDGDTDGGFPVWAIVLIAVAAVAVVVVIILVIKKK